MIDYSLPNTKMTSMNGRFKNPNEVLRTDHLVLDIIECLSIGCCLLMSPLLNCLGVCSPMDVRWWMVLPYLVDLWMPLHIWMLLANTLVKWPIHCLCFPVFFSSMLSNALLAHPITFQPSWCLHSCGKGSLLTSQHHAYISLLTPRLLMFSNFKFSLENHATLSHL